MTQTKGGVWLLPVYAVTPNRNPRGLTGVCPRTIGHDPRVTRLFNSASPEAQLCYVLYFLRSGASLGILPGRGLSRHPRLVRH
jgi:hypothetical protein